MAKWHITQSNFLAGELSPDYAAQLDTEYTRAGLALAQNALLNQSGTIRKSPGSTYIATLNNLVAPDMPTRVWGFYTEDNQWAAAIFTPGSVRVSTSVAQEQPPHSEGNVNRISLSAPAFTPVVILENPTPNYGNALGWERCTPSVTEVLLPTPNTSGRAYPIRLDSQAYAVEAGLLDANGAQLYGAQGGALLRHVVKPLDDSTPRGVAAQQLWMETPDLTGLGASEAGSRVVQKFTAPLDISDITARVQFRLPDWTDAVTPGGPSANKLFAEFPPETLGIRLRVSTLANLDAGVPFIDETIPLVTPGVAVTRGLSLRSGMFSASGLAGVLEGTELAVSVALVATGLDAHIQTTPEVEKAERGFLAAIQIDNVTVGAKGVQNPVFDHGGSIPPTTPYTAEQLDALHFAQSPFDDKELLVFHPEVAPHKLYRSSPTVWVFEPYVFVTPPALWGPKYPSTAVGYQGRLVLTGHPDAPETIWASKSNTWDTFADPAVGTNPNDPLEFTPTARGVNTWLSATRRLLFGSTTGEYSVDTASGLLQPSDIAVNPQTSHGHLAPVQPISVGPDVLLTTAGDRAVRLLKFTERSGGFEALDIGNHARHLLKRKVKRVVFVRDPAESIWLLMHDGSVLVANKEPDSDTPGYTQLNFNGQVKDLAVVYTPSGATNLVMAVARVQHNGTTSIHLDVVANLRNTDDWVYTNATTTVIKAIPTDTAVGGFTHLEGQRVQVLEDGAYTGSQYVTGGELLVAQDTGVVTAGLGFNFKITTFPNAMYDPRFGGLAAQKRFVEVGARVVNSAPPSINGQRSPDRTPADLMGDNPRYPGVRDYQVTGRGLSTYDGITVEDAEPFAFSLVGIFAKITANDA